MSDIWDNADVQAWKRRAEAELVPMIKDSSVTLQLWSDVPDAKIAVELGFTLMLGKPLVILKRTGENVPPHLARIASAIVEYDTLDDPSLMERVYAEVERITGDGP